MKMASIMKMKVTRLGNMAMKILRHPGKPAS